MWNFITLLKNIDFLNINIDILINNAGFGTYGRFETIAAELEQDEISVNVFAVVSITHALIPGMIARQSGVILNIASTASFQPSAFMAVYAASKAFVLNFSEALWAEYQDRGIYVAALCPGPVETGFIDKLGDKTIRQTAVFSKTVSAEYVAKKTMKVLQSNHPTHILGFKNWVMINSIRFVPRALVAKVGAKMLKSKLK